MSASLPALSPVGPEASGQADRPQTVEYSVEQVSEALFGQDGPSFKDLLAAINPLQHIPVVGTIYRYLTGDTLSPGSRLAGGALYGGPLGLISAGINAAIEGGTGKDLGDHVLAMVVEPKPAAPADAPPTLLAAAEPPPLPAPPPAAPAIGPAVTANPVTPVAQAAVAPPGNDNAPLTPAAYARAIAAANGRIMPPMPARAAQGSAPPVAELSNDDFVRLLASFGQGGNAPATPAQPQPVQPVPVAVPVAGAEYRSPRAPAIIRAPGRFTPQFAR